MAISITGRNYDSTAAGLYASNLNLRSFTRGVGLSLSQRNSLAKNAEARRLGYKPDSPEIQTYLQDYGLLRVMYMMSNPGFQYIFTTSPASFTVEGFGAEISEIPRPYNIPIVDIKGGKSRRVSFEFLIVGRVGNGRHSYHHLYQSVEEEIKQIQLIADMSEPVGFDNINAIMQENYWYIDNISFTYTRDNSTGNTVSAQCTVSLIEFKSLRQKFVLLPKFRYGKFTSQQKKLTDEEKKAIKDRINVQKANKISAISKATRAKGGGAGSSLYG